MTFSIVARNPDDGSLGVATATAGPAVGALVPHGAAGVGVVATQAMTNPYLAQDCLALLPTLPAQQAMEAALARDPEPRRRQFIAVDSAGATACWTGDGCEQFAGHRAGDGIAVAGNILSGPNVLEAMLDGYGHGTAFEQRLLAALIAGQREGGDVRGTGSAAIKIYGREAFPTIDLRVDWSAAPLEAMSALLEQTTKGSYAEFFKTIARRYS